MNVIARQTFTKDGIKIPHNRNFSNNGLSSSQLSAELGDAYFRKTNDFPWSPGIAAAVIEIAGAGALLKCFPGPTTWVNLLTTVAETANVLVSKSEKIRKDIKDECLAWFQVLAGMSGFGGIIKESFFDKEEKDFSDVPIWERICLSGASAFNVFSMASGAIEKSLLSMVCKNREEENERRSTPEYRTSRSSAQSDRRCKYEWFFMALVPWLFSINAVKKIADVLISYFAIKEGCETFAERANEGKKIFLVLPEKIQGKKLAGLVKFLDNPFFFLKSQKEEKEEYKLLWPYDKFIKFLIGTEEDKGGKGQSGFRNYCLKPIFRFLGTNPPLYFLDKDENIVVEFNEETNPEGGISKTFSSVVETVCNVQVPRTDVIEDKVAVLGAV